MVDEVFPGEDTDLLFKKFRGSLAISIKIINRFYMKYFLLNCSDRTFNFLGFVQKIFY